MRKLKVFTIQPKEVYDKLVKFGEVYVDETKLTYPEFTEAYD